MKLVVISVSIIFIFGGCGVDTSSSAGDSKSSVNIIEDGADTNSSSGVDDNSSSTDGKDNIPDGPVSSSNFNIKDAIFDKQACSIGNGYQVLIDSSFDPNATPDNDNGIEIESRYAYNTDVEATKVYIFYPILTQDKVFRNVNVYSENYRFGFDKAWISNVNTIYIRLAKDGAGHYSCYRYELNSLIGTELKSTKVYR